jgi:peptide/nickel transport system substrate-binding protein
MKSANHRQGRWSLALLLVTLSLVGAACGGSASPSPAASSGQSPAPTTAPTQATPAPAAQKITVAGPTALVDLDPQGPNAVEDPTTMVAGHIFDTVVEHKADAYVPALATEWTNPDDKSWSFKIRSDVKFTDGTPLTSADIKASIERVIRLDGPLAPLWASLASIDASDPATLVVKTTAPFGGMLTNMSLMYIVPAARADEKDFFLNPIGSGPFVVKSFNPGENLVLAKNATYWRRPQAR